MIAKKKGFLITHRPQLRLAKLIDRPGGISRDAAIENATRLVEDLRGSSMTTITTLIVELEVLAGCQAGPAQRKQILRVADQIINLAGTFGLVYLAEAAKRLCDIVFAFDTRNEYDAAAIAVHIRALKLLGPGSLVSDHDANSVLAELRKVLAHFGVAIPAETEDQVPVYDDAAPDPRAAAGWH